VIFWTTAVKIKMKRKIKKKSSTLLNNVTPFLTFCMISFISLIFIRNRKRVKRETQIRIMFPTGMKIERIPEKNDNVKNPMKKNSSGLINPIFSFAPEILQIILATENPITEKSNSISIHKNITRIMLYALNKPYFKIQ
jgi:hypothetical protein